VDQALILIASNKNANLGGNIPSSCETPTFSFLFERGHQCDQTAKVGQVSDLIIRSGIHRE
jgi:hypothetical protein